MLKKLSMVAAGATIAVLGIVATTQQAEASSPFRLEYSVVDLGTGLYDYEFDLILDNNDGSWSAGQEIDWLIFGDAPFGSSSPLTNWVGDFSRSDSIISGFAVTSGDHNGPTLVLAGNAVFLPGWTPSGIGDTLEWAGTSTANLTQGNLLWSNVVAGGGASLANFEVATRVSRTNVSVPEPASILGLLAFGAISLKRKQKQNA